jgi:glutamyl-tRNA reductase
MNLFCVGMSHHTANVETREMFSGNREAECVLREAGCAEALVLTTCNRVEVYAASEKHIATPEVARCLSRKIDPPSHSYGEAGNHHSAFYRHENAECVQHLFRVASGLDSMVVGETEVLGQAKKAYESARASGAAGPFLHRLFQRAFRAAKEVRSQTDITRGAVSVGSVAVDLAAKIFGDLSHCKVLVIGAGENAERTARALASRGVVDLRVSNRSPERARDLAANVGGTAVAFETWPDHLGKIDILITSTAAETPLLTAADFETTLRARIDRPLFVIDIAVPRNVDSRVNDMDGVYLYDIDSLRSIAEQARALRHEQIADAEKIIAEHVAKFQETLARGLEWRARNPAHDATGRDGSPGCPKFV